MPGASDRSPPARADSYDALGQVIASTTPPTATNPSGNTTSYGHDPAGNPVSKTDPGGSCPAFNAGAWPPTLSPSRLCTAYAYDNAGQLRSVSYSDGMTPKSPR